MGLIHDRFGDRVQELWSQARQLKREKHHGLTWTCGVMKCRDDFLDLQTQGLALAASILIHHEVVPEIIFSWDVQVPYDATARDKDLRLKYYPLYLLRAFPQFDENMLERTQLRSCYAMEDGCLKLYRSPLSVNPWSWGRGQGYRSKYLGMQFATTSHAIISDIDTICTRPCIDYLTDQIAIDPSTFCLTNWHNEKNLSVGLCVYNVAKYRLLFLPLLQRMHWQTKRADSTFIPSVLQKFPEFADQLDIRLFCRNKINVEKFHKNSTRQNYWTDESAVYHAWKGEFVRDEEGFFKYYESILDDLENRLQK